VADRPDEAPRWLETGDIAHLRAYLTDDRQAENLRVRLLGLLLSWGLPIGAVLLAVLIYRASPSFLCLGLFLGGGLYSAIGEFLRRQAMAQTWGRAHTNLTQRKALETTQDLLKRGTLAKRLHPAVGLALDRLAMRAIGIRSGLSRPDWRQLAKNRHWNEVRENALRGVDEAMLDSLVTSQPYIRHLGMRKADFAEAVRSDPAPERALATLQLFEKKLVDLERGIHEIVGSANESQLDRALGEIAELRRATAELDDDQEPPIRRST
jgi:hypothetical protein